MTIDLSALSAEELDQLIVQAAERRASLEPKLPGQRPESGFLAIGIGPWHLTPISDGVILQLGHPSFGWLAFDIPAATRAHILTALLHQALLNPQKAGDPLPTPARLSGTDSGGTLH